MMKDAIRIQVCCLEDSFVVGACMLFYVSFNSLFILPQLWIHDIVS